MHAYCRISGLIFKCTKPNYASAHVEYHHAQYIMVIYNGYCPVISGIQLAAENGVSRLPSGHARQHQGTAAHQVDWFPACSIETDTNV